MTLNKSQNLNELPVTWKCIWVFWWSWFWRASVIWFVGFSALRLIIFAINQLVLRTIVIPRHLGEVIPRGYAFLESDLATYCFVGFLILFSVLIALGAPLLPLRKVIGRTFGRSGFRVVFVSTTAEKMEK